MKKITIPFLSMLAALSLTIGLASCSALTGDSGAAVPIGSNQDTGIWVTGVGKVTVTPDMAVIAMGIQAQAETVTEAQRQASEAMSAVMTAIKNKGVSDKDIATTAYNIAPVYSYDRNTGNQNLDGYSVSNSISVKVRSIANAGAVIDAAATAGGNYTRINSVTLTVDKPEQYSEQAREAAMTDAATRAKQLAKLGGIKLGKPAYIAESTANPWRTIYYESPANANIVTSDTVITPGETEVTVTLQVVYTIS
ncbi:MAG: SIMPL domain-containing protein [Dehalococcoidia bacterium]|nr:SIMPL domain-containing protein [Dehalococcoidia bacterium]